MLFSMIAVMVVLMGLAVPVAVAIGLAGVVGTAGFSNLPLLVIPQQAFIALDKFPLAAIPFFIVAGNLMAAGGISKRLVDLVESVIGDTRGGLPVTCIVVCMIFAAVSGSSVATTYAIGAILIPAMVRQNYPVGFAASLQATAAELGVIIPPSIPMILYGVMAGASIVQLFVAGIVPGLLAGFTMMGLCHYYAVKYNWPVEEMFQWGKLWRAFKEAWAALSLPIIILGGIFGGVVTATEGAALAVVAALFVGGVIYRDLSWERLRSAIIDCSAVPAPPTSTTLSTPPSSCPT